MPPKPAQRMVEVKPESITELAKDTSKLSRVIKDGLTEQQAADLFGTSRDALMDTFGPVVRQAKAERQLMLLRSLQTQADKGQAEAVAWLISEVVRVRRK